MIHAWALEADTGVNGGLWLWGPIPWSICLELQVHECGLIHSPSCLILLQLITNNPISQFEEVAAMGQTETLLPRLYLAPSARGENKFGALVSNDKTTEKQSMDYNTFGK